MHGYGNDSYAQIKNYVNAIFNRNNTLFNNNINNSKIQTRGVWNNEHGNYHHNDSDNDNDNNDNSAHDDNCYTYINNCDNRL